MEATEAAIADTFKALEARLGGAADRLQPAASKKNHPRSFSVENEG